MSQVKGTFFSGIGYWIYQLFASGQSYGLWKAKQALGRCCENGHGADVDLEAAAQKYLDGYGYGRLECRESYLRCREKLPSEWDSRKVLT